MSFDPRQADRFVFGVCSYDPADGTARLAYRFEGGPELVETLTFPHAPWPPEPSRQAAFERALQLLHLIAGASYYKAGAVAEMQFESGGLQACLPDFATTLYQQGLAEFGHVNGLDMATRVNFPAASEAPPEALSLLLPDRALVAMGGGKDSLVGLQMLRDAEIEVQPVCVGGSELIGETVRAAGLPLLRIGRSLSPVLRQMNDAGALNGHVPVTAINSAILLCASILYGFRFIVFANERSADEATVVREDGIAVNHQYSKSSAFERDFRAVIRQHISAEIEYFSVLRAHSELAVVQQFSRLKTFHGVYSSCNRNFHLEGSRVSDRWCRDCPKCRFAALSLAVFLPPEEVQAIMGGDMLDDQTQLNGFRALGELGVEKPFECVGEAGESRAAMAALSRSPLWRDHTVVKALAPELESLEISTVEDLLQPAEHHFIPRSLQSPLAAAWQQHENG